jgi:hypothetical protein
MWWNSSASFVHTAGSVDFSVCVGYFWVNGMNTGVYLDSMGVAQVGQYPCGQQVSVQIVDEFGQFSHIEVVTMVSPVTTLNFSWW